MKLRKSMALLLASTMAMATCGGSSSSSSDNSSSERIPQTAPTAHPVMFTVRNRPGTWSEIMNDFTEKTGIKTKVSVVKWDEYWTLLERSTGRIIGCILDAFRNERYMSMICCWI